MAAEASLAAQKIQPLPLIEGIAAPLPFIDDPLHIGIISPPYRGQLLTQRHIEQREILATLCRLLLKSDAGSNTADPFACRDLRAMGRPGAPTQDRGE